MLPTGLRLGAKQHDPVWCYCASEIARELVQGVDDKLAVVAKLSGKSHYERRSVVDHDRRDAGFGAEASCSNYVAGGMAPPDKG
jgi:hypothetical protein